MDIYNSRGKHEKTPKMFIVTLQERYFDAPGTDSSKIRGPHSIKDHNGGSVNMYGFATDTTAQEFDLSQFLIGVRDKNFHWPAKDKDILLAELAADPDIKAGSMWLIPDKESVREPIQDLPECSRMYTHKETGTIICGKPTNELGDGCLGTCILQGGDVEFEDGGCPLRTFWDKQFEKKKVVVS